MAEDKKEHSLVGKAVGYGLLILVVLYLTAILSPVLDKFWNWFKRSKWRVKLCLPVPLCLFLWLPIFIAVGLVAHFIVGDMPNFASPDEYQQHENRENIGMGIAAGVAFFISLIISYIIADRIWQKVVEKEKYDRHIAVILGKSAPDDVDCPKPAKDRPPKRKPRAKKPSKLEPVDWTI